MPNYTRHQTGQMLNANHECCLICATEILSLNGTHCIITQTLDSVVRYWWWTTSWRHVMMSYQWRCTSH